MIEETVQEFLHDKFFTGEHTFFHLAYMSAEDKFAVTSNVNVPSNSSTAVDTYYLKLNFLINLIKSKDEDLADEIEEKFPECFV